MGEGTKVPPLSDEEILRFRVIDEMFTEHDLSEMKEHAQYRIARRIIFRTWRKWAIGIALVITTLALARDNIKPMLKGLLGWASG